LVAYDRGESEQCAGRVTRTLWIDLNYAGLNFGRAMVSV